MLKHKISHQLLIYLGMSLIAFVLLGAAGMQAKASQSPNLIAQGK